MRAKSPLPMSEKPDFLKECLSDASAQVGRPVPIDELHRECCQRCANRGCARSSLNNSVFDVRTREWKQRLFESPPRAAEGDPRYSNIASKLFVPSAPSVVVSSGPAVINQAAVSRPNQGFVSVEQENQAAPPPPPPPPPDPAIRAPEAAIPELVTAPASAPRAPEAPPATTGVPGNTPFQQGAMLGGAPAQQKGQELGADKTFVMSDD